MATLKEKVTELHAMEDRMAAIYREFPENGSIPEEKAKELRGLNDEMSGLTDEVASMQAEDETRKRLEASIADRSRPVNAPPFAGGRIDGGGSRRGKSLGAQFVGSADYKGWSKGRGNQFASLTLPAVGFRGAFGEGDMQAATFDTAGSTLTTYDRQAGILLIGLQRLTVRDLLAKGETQSNTIRYVREDTYTNAATTVAEGAVKPEASFDTSEADAPVRKIAVTAKVTDELFADYPAMRDYIDNRLRYMVAEREEAQLLNGNGTSPNIRGILQTAGIQTQAKGGDPVPTAMYKGLTKVRAVGFFEPDGIITHPNDWQDVRTLQDTAGNYIWGHPAEAGPERMFGKLVVITTAIVENTALVGAFQLGAQIFDREGVTVEATNSNEDDFKKNLIALRAEERLALAVYRPLAFCTVTGI